MVLLLLFFSLISISPVFSAFDVHGRHLIVFEIFCLLIVCFMNKRRLKKWPFPVAIMLFAPALIPALFWNEPRLALLPLFLFVAVLLLAQSTSKEVSRYTDCASWFLFIILIGAVIAYFLAKFGVAPLTAFQNPDGRLNYFFYTTLTNVFEGSYIRPSGIYDEPGALSFFVCIIAFARQKMGKDPRLTWVLLGLGLITFSLIHLIYILIFLCGEKISIRWLSRMALIVALAFMVLVGTGLGETFKEKLLSRLEINETGQLVGDNRSELMFNAIDTLKNEDHAWLVGVDPNCTFNVLLCKQRWGAMIANPFDPLVAQGIFLSWPYYFFILMTFLSLLGGKKNLTFFAVGLLFAQRPYVLVIGYSFMAVLAVWLQLATTASSVGEDIVMAK